jgi:hypothetical protein
LTRVRSQIWMPAISFSSAGTAYRFNGYDERCRRRAKGKFLKRNASTEHTIEKENPKHSPLQNAMTSKRATYSLRQ